MIQTGMSGFIGFTGFGPQVTDMNAILMLILRPSSAWLKWSAKSTCLVGDLQPGDAFKPP